MAPASFLNISSTSEISDAGAPARRLTLSQAPPSNPDLIRHPPDTAKHPQPHEPPQTSNPRKRLQHEASLATPRRRWSPAAKERIVAEATQPGANVSANARTHWLSPNKFLCGAGRRWSVPGRRTRARRSRLSPWLCAFAEAGGIVEFVMGGVT